MTHDFTDNAPTTWWYSDERLNIGSGDEVKSTVSSSRKVKTIPSKYAMPQLDFRHKIAFELAAVPEVEAVFTSEYGKVFFVWTVVKERNADVYQKLYGKEQQLIDANEPIQFDFTIMASNGHDPKSIITDPMAQIAYARQ
jgi:hypothetical protein